MEAPMVQYVTAADGTSVAYGVSGEGEPFVFMPIFLSHFGHMWSSHSLSTLAPSLAERFQLIAYDPRGQGLSSRNLPEDVCLDDFIEDFEAVREHLALQRFVMLGSCNWALLAAHYAARYPGRVKALILVNGAVSWDAWRLSSVYDTLPREDWDLFLHNMAPLDYTPEQARALVESAKASILQRDYLVSTPVWHSASLEDILPRLHTPTLVLHSKDFRLRSVEGPLELARRLANAKLRLMDSNWLFGHPGQAIAAIDEFMADLEAGEAKSSATVPAFPSSGLSARQAQVLRLIAEGKTNGEIADELVISLRTVERHVAELYAKIGARNRVEAAAFAMSSLVRA